MKKYVSIQLSFFLNMQIDIRKFFCLERLAFQQECVEGDSYEHTENNSRGKVEE